MLIAREKKKTNIAEYILYMWQVEDIIRACMYDMSLIDENIIQPMKLDKYLYEETKVWYSDLVEKMKKEKIVTNGHLSFVNDSLEQLENFHAEIISSKNDTKYFGFYKLAKPNIDVLRNKSNNENQGDVTLCLTGLYGLLVLRLQKKVISQETNDALKTISNMIAYLSKLYMKKET